MDKQKYFNELMGKFNEDPNDESITREQRKLLQAISSSSGMLRGMSEEAKELEKEVSEKQTQLNTVRSNMIKVEVKINTLVDTIFMLCEDEDG